MIYVLCKENQRIIFIEYINSIGKYLPLQIVSNIDDINKRVSGQDAVTQRLGSKETMSMDKEAGVSRRAKYKPTKPNPKKYSEELFRIRWKLKDRYYIND